MLPAKGSSCGMYSAFARSLSACTKIHIQKVIAIYLQSMNRREQVNREIDRVTVAMPASIVEN